MSDEGAREKVGHCLRDMIASQREDKNKAAKGLAKKNKKTDTLRLAPTDPPGRAEKMETNRTTAKPPIVESAAWLGGRPARFPSQVEAASLLWSAHAHAQQRSLVESSLGNPASYMAHPGHMPRPPVRPMMMAPKHPMQVPLSFNNLDSVSLQKGTLQDMSEQQRKILTKLESGFKGTVEELMDSVR